jgi:hypothetical protein
MTIPRATTLPLNVGMRPRGSGTVRKVAEALAGSLAARDAKALARKSDAVVVALSNPLGSLNGGF